MSEMQQGAWTKPAAMAIPKGGFSKDKVEQGRYGPIFPKTPAATAFRFSQNHPRSGEVFYEYAKNIEKTVAAQPTVLLCSSCTTSAGSSFPSTGRPTLCIRASSIQTSTKYTEDAVASLRGYRH